MIILYFVFMICEYIIHHQHFSFFSDGTIQYLNFGYNTKKYFCQYLTLRNIVSYKTYFHSTQKSKHKQPYKNLTFKNFKSKKVKQDFKPNQTISATFQYLLFNTHNTECYGHILVGINNWGSIPSMCHNVKTLYSLIWAQSYWETVTLADVLHVYTQQMMNELGLFRANNWDFLQACTDHVFDKVSPPLNET